MDFTKFNINCAFIKIHTTEFHFIRSTNNASGSFISLVLVRYFSHLQ